MPPDKEARPPAGTRSKLDGHHATSSPLSLPVVEREVAARRAWAYSLLRRAKTPAPRYGSAEWAGLADADPRKVASCVRAAECWTTAAENLPDDLRAELDAVRLETKRQDDLDYVARWKAHRGTWSRRTPTGKSYAERRTEQLQAAKQARSGDYPGRGSAS